ncbi:DUF3667 domain-containing protein [Rhodanobacter glycinis]|nr:DUF3667 domain-containing protein [Rhodanobacter glycinis]
MAVGRRQEMHEPAGLPDEPLPVCVNCGAPLAGAFCAQCGERRLQPGEHTLGHIVAEWFEAFSHGEGRLLASLRMLMSKPGELTCEYFRGRRVPYARPVALFFAVNLLFFVLGTVRTFTTPLYFQMNTQPLAQTKQALVLKKALGEKASATDRVETMGDYSALYESLKAEVDAGRPSATAEVAKRVATSRHPAELTALQRYEQSFDEHTEALSRALLVVLVPMLAGFLWLTLAPLHRGLPELAIFATHLWSGLLLVLLLFGWLLTGVVHLSRWLSAGRVPAVFQNDNFASMAIGALLMVYVYRALRRYFEFPRAGCAVLTAWMLAGLYLSLQLYRLMLFYVTVYVMHG